MPIKKFKDPFLKTQTPGSVPTQRDVTSSTSQKKGSSKIPPFAETRPEAESPLKTGLQTRTPGASTNLMVPSSGVPPATGHTSKDGPSKSFNRETLKDSWNKLSGRTMSWLLEGERLESLLAETKLKDIGILAGISTEKVLLMEGQPTQIIAQAQQVKLDQLGIVLKDALEKRGIVTLTERKAEISLDGPGTPSKARSDKP
jgi:hypothetical protein